VADDVSIVISAQDQASEVLKSIGKNTEKLAQTMSKSSVSTEKLQKGFSFAVKGFVAFKAASIAATASIKGLTASIAGMKASVEAFQLQEKVAKGMTQAQLDFASAMQKATNIGDEATLGLMKQAEAMGYTKELSGDLVLASAGLARKFGIDQKQAMDKLTSALMGNASAFDGLMPGLTRVHNEFSKLEIVNAAVAEGLQQLKDDTQTTTGAMARSSGAFGDLNEKIGALFDPIFRVTHTGLAVFAETLQTALGPAINLVNDGFASAQPYIEAFIKAMQTSAQVVGAAIEVMSSMVGGFFTFFTANVRTSASVAESFTSIFDQIARVVIKALTMVEVAWNNLPIVIRMAIDSTALILVRFANDVAHLFTVVIPAYTSWFATNFTNILRDGFNAAKTVITNFFTVAADLVQKGFTFITSRGTEGSIDFALSLSKALSTNLLDGFEATTDELPQIAERAATETEKALERDLGKAAGFLADQYESKVQERLDRLKTKLDTKVDVKAPDVVDMKLDVSAKLGNALSNIQASQAVTGRLLTKGRDDSLQRRMAQQGAEANRLLREIKENIRGVKENTGKEPKPVQGPQVEVIARA